MPTHIALRSKGGNMKKVVISGSLKLQKETDRWREYFFRNNYEILDYPKPIEEARFLELYPAVYGNFKTAG